MGLRGVIGLGGCGAVGRLMGLGICADGSLREKDGEGGFDFDGDEIFDCLFVLLIEG